MNKIYYSFIIVIIIFFAYGAIDKKFNEKDKNKPRLNCQNETITFEKIAYKPYIKEAINSLQTNNYEIKSRIEKAVFMKSEITNILNINEANKMLTSIINENQVSQQKTNEKLTIDYYILENDKKDTRKKGGASCKLYAGFLVFEFIYKNKLVYKIQTDYMNNSILDIKNRMECVIKSFISLKGEL